MRPSRAFFIAALLALAGCGSSSDGDAATGDASADGPAAVRLPPPQFDAHVAPPPNADGVRAGRACYTDDDCDSDVVTCNAKSGLGLCTRSCARSNAAAEQARCGGEGTVCVAGNDASDGLCTRACRGSGRSFESTGCSPGQACTTLWFANRQATTRAGCVKFCGSDAECLPGMRCHPRTGACGYRPFDETALEDGSPCDATIDGRGGVWQCRGVCVPWETSDFTRGTCLSYVNGAVSRACPDNPDRMRWFAPISDGLGVCVLRACAQSSDCPSPMRCQMHPVLGSMLCSWPS